MSEGTVVVEQVGGGIGAKASWWSPAQAIAGLNGMLYGILDLWKNKGRVEATKTLLEALQKDEAALKDIGDVVNAENQRRREQMKYHAAKSIVQTVRHSIAFDDEKADFDVIAAIPYRAADIFLEHCAAVLPLKSATGAEIVKMVLEKLKTPEDIEDGIFALAEEGRLFNLSAELFGGYAGHIVKEQTSRLDEKGNLVAVLPTRITLDSLFENCAQTSFKMAKSVIAADKKFMSRFDENEVLYGSKGMTYLDAIEDVLRKHIPDFEKTLAEIGGAPQQP